MRILHVCSRYWPGVGGIETHFRGLSERLAADGHQVTVVTSDAADTELFWDPRRRRLPVRDEVFQGVRILRFPLRHLPGAPLTYSLWRYIIFNRLATLPVVPLPWLMAWARFTPWVPELWRWVAETRERYDVVGAMGILYEPFVAAARQLATLRRVPFVVYPLTHLGAGSVPGKDPVSRYYVMRHQVALVCSADAIVANTPAEGKYYAQHGAAPARICVGGPGVDPAVLTGGSVERFQARYALRGPAVAFLSAISYDKGAMHLVEAMQQLWANGLEAELLMAGSLTDRFQRYLASLPAKIRQRLHVLGPVSDEEKRDLLAGAEVLAMPSRSDSFGIVYLEAWLYGKPVVGARAWGMSDVIADGKDGLLVPFGDVRAQAEAIRFLLEYPERRAAMGARGREKVYAEYTWDKRYAVVRDLYERLAPA